MENKKILKEKAKESIHVYALLFFIVCIGMVLTWIIPAGQFDKIKNPTTNIFEYVQGSYHSVASNPQTPWDAMNAIFNGWITMAPLIFTVFAMGAWVQVLQDTDLIIKSFSKITYRLQGKEKYAVFCVMFIMLWIGAMGINPSVPLAPLGVVFALSLGYDSALGAMMIFFSNGLGFSLGAFNVTSIGIAHEISKLPPYSGYVERIIIMLITFSVLVFFVFRYMNAIKDDPTKSLSYGVDIGELTAIKPNSNEKIVYTIGDILNIFIAIGGFSILIYGVINWKWNAVNYGPLFLSMAILTGIFGKLGINGTAISMVNGMKSMTYSALIVGLAGGISGILKQGNIIDTLVFFLSKPVASFGKVGAAVMMVIINGIIDIFIPSNSGQAATIMPIFLPIGDLVGLTRQVTVQAYQFGGGITDMIIPTSTSLFVCLGISGISYKNYLKWFTPIFCLYYIIAFISIIILTLMNFGPF